MTRLIDRPGVANMLGITVEKLYRRLTELQALEHNPFPQPVLGAMSGARWDPDAITRWIKAGGEHAAAAPPPPARRGDDPDDDRAQRKAARRDRAAQLAAGA